MGRPNNPTPLVTRVADAANAALEEQGYVTALDVMLYLSWLQPCHVAEWQTRRLAYLEQGMQVSRERLAEALRLLATFAEQKGLQPTTADYVTRTAAREPLQFSESGAPEFEAAWRTQWTARSAAPATRARLAAKAQKPPELAAIVARHPDWKCHRCGGTGALLVMEPPGPACLTCAGLGSLAMVPAGDALLTRRARAGSKLTAVVLRWSQSRKRYERIGALVEPEALAAAQASNAAQSGGEESA